MEKTRIVKDPGKWRLMDGDSNLQKQMNSFLTSRFISDKNVPSNECLQEAQLIIEAVISYYKENGDV